MTDVLPTSTGAPAPAAASPPAAAPATVCADCLTGAVLAGKPKGTMERLGAMPYYATGAPFASADKVVLVLYDIFGLSIPNPKLIADTLSSSLGKQGIGRVCVLVPDYLLGDYADPARLKTVEQPIAQEPLLVRTKATFNMLASFMTSVGPLFLWRNRPAVKLALLTTFCDELRKSRGESPIRIGVVGYCWGGVLSTLLAGTDTIDVAVTAHPGSLSASDFGKIKKPFSLIAAQGTLSPLASLLLTYLTEDMSFGALQPEADRILVKLASQGIPTESVTYAGTCRSS